METKGLTIIRRNVTNQPDRTKKIKEGKNMRGTARFFQKLREPDNVPLSDNVSKFTGIIVTAIVICFAVSSVGIGGYTFIKASRDNTTIFETLLLLRNISVLDAHTTEEAKQLIVIGNDIRDVVVSSNQTQQYFYDASAVLNTDVTLLEMLVQNLSIPFDFNITGELAEIYLAVGESRTFSNYSEQFYIVSASYSNDSFIYSNYSHQWELVAKNYSDVIANLRNQSIADYTRTLSFENYTMYFLNLSVYYSDLATQNAALASADAAQALNYSLASSNSTHNAKVFAMQGANYTSTAQTNAMLAQLYRNGSYNYYIQAVNSSLVSLGYSGLSSQYSTDSYNYYQLAYALFANASDSNTQIFILYMQTRNLANSTYYNYLSEVLLLNQSQAIRDEMNELFQMFNQTISEIASGNGTLNANDTSLLYSGIQQSVAALQAMQDAYNYSIISESLTEEANISVAEAQTCANSSCVCSTQGCIYSTNAQNYSQIASTYANYTHTEMLQALGYVVEAESNVEECSSDLTAIKWINSAVSLDSNGSFVFIRLVINGTSNQISFDRGNLVNIQVTSPVANTTVNLIDPGVSSTSFVLTDGNQTINDNKSFDGALTLSNLAANGTLILNDAKNIDQVNLESHQILLGVDGSHPNGAYLIGEAGQVQITYPGDDVQFSLPQAIATTSNVSFSNLALTGPTYMNYSIAATYGNKSLNYVLAAWIPYPYWSTIIGSTDAPQIFGQFATNTEIFIDGPDASGNLTFHISQDIAPTSNVTFRWFSLDTTDRGSVVTNSSGYIYVLDQNDGELIIGRTTGTAAPKQNTISGAANQIAVTNGNASITLSFPSNIIAASDLTITSLTITSTAADALLVDGPVDIGGGVNITGGLYVADEAQARSGMYIGNNAATNFFTEYRTGSYQLFASGGFTLTNTYYMTYTVVGSVVTLKLPTYNGTCNGLGAITLAIPAAINSTITDAVEVRSIGTRDSGYVQGMSSVYANQILAYHGTGYQGDGPGFTLGSPQAGNCGMLATTMTYFLY